MSVIAIQRLKLTAKNLSKESCHTVFVITQNISKFLKVLINIPFKEAHTHPK